MAGRDQYAALRSFDSIPAARRWPLWAEPEQNPGEGGAGPVLSLGRETQRE